MAECSWSSMPHRLDKHVQRHSGEELVYLTGLVDDDDDDGTCAAVSHIGKESENHRALSIHGLF